MKEETKELLEILETLSPSSQRKIKEIATYLQVGEMNAERQGESNQVRNKGTEHGEQKA